MTYIYYILSDENVEKPNIRLKLNFFRTLLNQIETKASKSDAKLVLKQLREIIYSWFTSLETKEEYEMSGFVHNNKQVRSKYSIQFTLCTL